MCLSRFGGDVKDSLILKEEQKTRSTGLGEGVQGQLRYLTLVVGFRNNEKPTPTSIGSRIIGGNCIATSLYDSNALLAVAMAALEEIQASPFEAESIAINALSHIDNARCFRDWMDNENPLNDEPGFALPIQQ